MEDRRIGTVSRKTKETDIFIKLNLDGDGTTETPPERIFSTIC